MFLVFCFYLTHQPNQETPKRKTLFGVFPGTTIGAAQHRLSVLVLGSGFLDRVPFDGALQARRDIAQMANRRAAMAYFGIGDRELARLDAIEPVLVVVGAEIPLEGVLGDIAQDRFVRSLEHAPVHKDPTLFAYELGPTLDRFVPLAEDDFGSGGVDIFDPGRHRDFVPVLGVIGDGSGDQFGTRIVHAEAPLGDIEMVGAKVGHLSAGVVPEEAEVVVDPFGVVRALGSGPEPKVIVELGGSGRIGNRRSGKIDIGNSHFDGGNFAQGPATSQGAGDVEVFARALLAACLDDPLVFAGGVDDGPTLFDGEGEGLFAVDMLAGFTGIDGDAGVPVVRGGDDDRVDVLVVEDAAIIPNGNGRLSVRFLHPVGGLGEALAVDIADGDDVLELVTHVRATLPARSNGGDADDFGRRLACTARQRLQPS